MQILLDIDIATPPVIHESLLSITRPVEREAQVEYAYIFELVREHLDENNPLVGVFAHPFTSPWRLLAVLDACRARKAQVVTVHAWDLHAQEYRRISSISMRGPT